MCFVQCMCFNSVFEFTLFYNVFFVYACFRETKNKSLEIMALLNVVVCLCNVLFLFCFVFGCHLSYCHIPCLCVCFLLATIDDASGVFAGVPSSVAHAFDGEHVPPTAELLRGPVRREASGHGHTYPEGDYTDIKDRVLMTEG